MADSNQQQALAHESVGRLLFRLAVPAITAQLVNMLYNIVDRIYIGHIEGIGADALTGVGVTFPIIMIVSAFSSLVGFIGGSLKRPFLLGSLYPEGAGIKSYSPCIGNYKNEHKDFSYDSQSDCFICRMNKKLSFIKIHKPTTRTYESKIYRSSQKDCSVCPLKGQCIKNKTYPVKELSTTIYKPYYENAYKRVHSPIGRKMKKLRSSTVEPVLGTLLDFRAMRKVRTRGIRLANKHVLLAAMAYNLKKLMRHVCYKSAIPVAKAANNWLDYIKLVTFNLTRTFLISFSYQNIPQKRVLII